MESTHSQFVTNLQRLLLEGDFVGTYKFALLISLARWAVENPNFESDREVDVSELAPHFLDLYWPQAQPFAPASTTREPGATYEDVLHSPMIGVLHQDRGQKEDRQAPRILKDIHQSYHECGGSIRALPESTHARLLQRIRETITVNPLWRLQVVRSSKEPLTTLYRPGRTRFKIRFEPGIARCFSHFAPLVEELARAGWMRHVLRCNPKILGAPSQVESFLFPDSRNALAALRSPLFEVQGDACFYCTEPLGRKVAVDHFLPWSKYRRDLGHNFVLAHPTCNRSKSDLLAGCHHLENWIKRNARHGPFLAEAFEERRIPHDMALSLRVAQSLYALADFEGAELWVGSGVLKPIHSEWKDLLGVA
ncbi:MAG: HNH endonuclease domain-containing protein [Planctomycetota bacterium]|nr:HNH endonuclease domain-containing protein [Planctomycetota bacterium]